MLLQGAVLAGPPHNRSQAESGIQSLPSLTHRAQQVQSLPAPLADLPDCYGLQTILPGMCANRRAQPRRRAAMTEEVASFNAPAEG
jgi:hypothetical protein